MSLGEKDASKKKEKKKSQKNDNKKRCDQNSIRTIIRFLNSILPGIYKIHTLLEAKEDKILLLASIQVFEEDSLWEGVKEKLSKQFP